MLNETFSLIFKHRTTKPRKKKTMQFFYSSTYYPWSKWVSLKLVQNCLSTCKYRCILLFCFLNIFVTPFEPRFIRVSSHNKKMQMQIFGKTMQTKNSPGQLSLLFFCFESFSCNVLFLKIHLSTMKITQNVAFKFLNFGISTNFCPFKTDLSGNTVWPQASGFQKLAKMHHFWHF